MTHSKHDLELPKTMSYAQITHLRELKNETNSDAQDFESFVEMITVEEEVTITMSSQLSSSKDSVSSYKSEEDYMALGSLGNNPVPELSEWY